MGAFFWALSGTQMFSCFGAIWRGPNSKKILFQNLYIFPVPDHLISVPMNWCRSLSQAISPSRQRVEDKVLPSGRIFFLSAVPRGPLLNAARNAKAVICQLVSILGKALRNPALNFFLCQLVTRSSPLNCRFELRVKCVCKLPSYLLMKTAWVLALAAFRIYHCLLVKGVLI